MTSRASLTLPSPKSGRGEEPVLTLPSPTPGGGEELALTLSLDMLLAIAKGLNRRFPDGNDPYQIMTRLVEECGELAQQVNHFENAGVKRQKHGEPDQAHLVKEIQDVITCALQVMLHYQAEEALLESMQARYLKMKNEGLID